jgi:hypothetical protein
MPNDVERLFAALAQDATKVRLAPAADVRRRGDRRLLVQSVAGLAAVAVLVAGVTIGARTVLAGPDPAPVLPASPAPSAPLPSTPAPSGSTPAGPVEPSSPPPSSPPPSSPAAPSIPDSIPARAFLQKADWNGTVVDGPERTSYDVPRLCGALPPGDELLGVSGTSMLTYRAPDVPAEYTPNGIVYDTVTVYRGSGASDFLRELRDAARTCPVDTIAGREYRYRSRGSVGSGDESLLIEESTAGYDDAGEPTGGKRYAYIAAVRVGDTVALVQLDGWESASAKRADAVTFARAAGRRVGDWRG